MQFKEHIETLKPLENYNIEIILNSWESYIIENKPWKQWSIRIIQNHLWIDNETTKKIDLTQFCEFYEEWNKNKDTHPTIWILSKYNNEWWKIRKI